MNDDVKKLLKDLKDNVEIISHKVKFIETTQMVVSEKISFLRDQQSVMNEKLDNIVADVEDLTLNHLWQERFKQIRDFSH